MTEKETQDQPLPTIKNANRFENSRAGVLRLTTQNIEDRLKKLGLYLSSEDYSVSQVVQEFFEQRKLRPGRVKDFMDAYRAGWSAVTVVLLGHILGAKDDSVVMDGQHRLVALLLLFYEGFPINFTFNAMNLDYKDKALRNEDYVIATNNTLSHKFADTVYPVVKRLAKLIDKAGRAAAFVAAGGAKCGPGRPRVFKMKTETLAAGIEILASDFTLRPSDNPLRKADPIKARKEIEASLKPTVATVATWQARVLSCPFLPQVKEPLFPDSNHTAASVFLALARRHAAANTTSERDSIADFAFMVSTSHDTSGFAPNADGEYEGSPLKTTHPAAILHDFFMSLRGKQTGSGFKGTEYIPLAGRIAKTCLEKYLAKTRFKSLKDLKKLVEKYHEEIQKEAEENSKFSPTTL